MVLQVTIGVFVRRSSSSSIVRRSIASEVIIIIVWGSFSVLEVPLKSIDNAGADPVFARVRGSKSVRSERNGSRPLSGSFSK